MDGKAKGIHFSRFQMALVSKKYGNYTPSYQKLLQHCLKIILKSSHQCIVKILQHFETLGFVNGFTGKRRQTFPTKMVLHRFKLDQLQEYPVSFRRAVYLQKSRQVLKIFSQERNPVYFTTLLNCNTTLN